jgi:colicin import membrane protein
MKLNRSGLIGTIVYHALLLLLLIFAGLTFPYPPPGEEGILVNFGTDETGFGEYEPSGDAQNAGKPEVPVEEESREQPAVQESPGQTAVQEPREQVQRETPPDRTSDQTQDVEQTRVKEPATPTPEELERQRQAELERQKQAELERQKQAELERIERERREEQERIERERQQQAERINNLGRDAFGRQGIGETDGSQGVTEGEGNQGVPEGTAGADRYDTGGGLGDGITFGGLGTGRTARNVPKPDVSGCEVTSRIEVLVDITVDREGKVVAASVNKATYSDKCIWDMVMEAARKSRFSMDQGAAFRENGWIRYIIVP